MTIDVSGALSHIKHNWKTTVSGILTAIIGLSAVASAPNPWIDSALGQKILGAAAIAKILLSLIQRDATQTVVNLPAGTPPMQVNVPPGSTTTVTTPEKP